MPLRRYSRLCRLRSLRAPRLSCRIPSSLAIHVCSQAAWRRVVQLAVGAGIAVPGMTASLAYFDTYRRGRLPANLVQVGRSRGGALGGRPGRAGW